MSLHPRIGRWRHTETGLELRLGDRVELVPEPIDQWLIGPAGVGLSEDGAEDLIRLEHRLRSLAARLAVRTREAEDAVRTARKGVRALEGERGWGARGRRRAAAGDLRRAVEEHNATRETLDDAHTLVEVLREWVIELNPSGGLLRQAADGWQRSPEPPAHVVVFDDEESFVAADFRRATVLTWVGPRIAGEENWGQAWRRDGDEDDPLVRDSDRAGPWSVGWIERTGEIYAIRRCSYLSGRVWLLAKGFNRDQAYLTLGSVASRMREPNSLILVAETAGAGPAPARTRQCLTPRRPPDSARLDPARSLDAGDAG